MPVTSCLNDDELGSWAEGSLAPERQKAMGEHLNECPTCRTILSELARTEGDRPREVTLGRYVLQEKVGAGGMGTVWAAWDPMLGRRVAVKILHEAQHERSTQRFLHERQILAGLEHPNIGALLDAGDTAEGQPYFVMEFVDGEPIDLYCDRRRLGVRERLELMVPVFGAVSYAHQRLVVHRDLKPSNILVSNQGVPKLVDFGIARLLEADAALTATGYAPMTPAFASPEQVRREPAVTTSDVYSLGVVLHELLTGTGPYAVDVKNLDALLDAIRREEPSLASQALQRVPDDVLRVHGGSRERLSRELRGDLDAIIAMALRKEVRDRYQSVDALSDDVRAWLDGAPTVARRGSGFYRAVRFVRRYKAAVAVTLTAVLALSAGLGATLWQARRAQAERDVAARRFEQVRSLAHSVLFDYHDAIARLTGSTLLRARLASDATSYLDSLASEAADDEHLRVELAQGYLKVGDVEGDPFAGSLGDTDKAQASYRKARTLADEVLAKDPRHRGARQALAASHLKVGAILEVSNDLRAAVTEYELARAIDAELLAEVPADVDVSAALISDEIALGQALRQLGQLDVSYQWLSMALKDAETVAHTRPEVRFRRALAVTHLSLSQTLGEQVKLAEAVAEAKQAEAVFEALIAEYPDAADYRRNLVTTWTHLSSLLTLQHAPGALEYCKKAVDRARRDLDADPRNAVARRDLVVALVNLGGRIESTDDFVGAQPIIAEALAEQQRLVNDDPKNLQSRRDLIAALQSSAFNALARDDLDAAEKHYLEVEEATRDLLAIDPDNVEVAERQYDAQFGLIYVAAGRKRFDQALAQQQRTRINLESLMAKHPELGRLKTQYANTLGAEAEVRLMQLETLHGDARAKVLEPTREAHQRALDAYVALKDAGLAAGNVEGTISQMREGLAKCASLARR